MESLKKLKSRIIDENFFRPRWYSIFINPYFINRWTLYRSMQTFAAHVPADAKILDIGCGIKPYRSLFASPSYIGIDIEGGGHGDEEKTVDAYYDGENVPFPDNSFDVTLCTQVLEHASNPAALVSEASRVLSSGGTVFFSMPFVYPEHETPYDFRRFTRFEHTRLLEGAGFKDIRIMPTTGFFGVFSQLFVVMCFEGMHFRAPLLKALLTFFIFAPIQALGLLLDFVFRKPALTMDYVVTATKI
ncbi:MAG: class I SAM-dependent methyltransferase [Candidatus Paceibacterota bacterium]